MTEMSLQEKVEAAASEADGGPEAAAPKLKESVTAKERQSVWSKHQTWLRVHDGHSKGKVGGQDQPSGTTTCSYSDQQPAFGPTTALAIC